jgi:hypothetical protein
VWLSRAAQARHTSSHLLGDASQLLLVPRRISVALQLAHNLVLIKLHAAVGANDTLEEAEGALFLGR